MTDNLNKNSVSPDLVEKLQSMLEDGIHFANDLNSRLNLFAEAINKIKPYRSDEEFYNPNFGTDSLGELYQMIFKMESFRDLFSEHLGRISEIKSLLESMMARASLSRTLSNNILNNWCDDFCRNDPDLTCDTSNCFKDVISAFYRLADDLANIRREIEAIDIFLLRNKLIKLSSPPQ